jgi:hypothetical protein
MKMKVIFICLRLLGFLRIFNQWFGQVEVAVKMMKPGSMSVNAFLRLFLAPNL